MSLLQHKSVLHEPAGSSSLTLSPLQVVSRICEVSHRTRLLVVDRDTDDYLCSQGLSCTEDLAVEMGTLSPRPSPMSTPSASPVPRVISPLTFKFNHRQVLDRPAAESRTRLTSQDKEDRSSVASSSPTDTEVRGHEQKGQKIHAEKLRGLSSYNAGVAL